MKLILSALLLTSLVLNASSQDLVNKISDKAFAVLAINGGVTLEKVSEAEINKSQVFKEVMDEFFRIDADLQILSLEEFGINFRERMYFVGETGNDVNFYYFAYNISNLAAFETTVKEKIPYEKFQEDRGLNIVFYAYNSAIFWNNQTAIFISANYVGEEFANYYWDDFYYEYEESAEVAVEVPLEEMNQEEWDAYMKESKEKAEKEKKERELADQEREKKRLEKQRNLESKVMTEMSDRVFLFFGDELKSQNKQFKHSMNDAADASFWYANNFSMLDLFLGINRPYSNHYYYNPYRDLLSFSNFFGGEITCDLFLRETAINLDAKITYSAKLADDYSEVLSQKINKKFTNYISSSDVGYMSSSFSTEALLNAYPNIIENVMLKYDTTYSDEYSVIADIFNLVVDEEAVANAVTGDALFIFNGLSTKEVEHYYYDYDENYNYERKLEKRMELVPDFTFLMGSKEAEMIQKIFKIAVKHGGIEPIGKGYQLIDERHDFPFELYFAYQNEIVLFSTSVMKLDEFIKGGTSNKIGADHIKNITKNSSAFYLDLKTLFTGLLETDLRKSEARVFTEMRDNLSTVSAQMKSKNGATIVNTTLPVPATEANGAAYLLHFVDKIIKAEKNRD